VLVDFNLELVAVAATVIRPEVPLLQANAIKTNPATGIPAIAFLFGVQELVQDALDYADFAANVDRRAVVSDRKAPRDPDAISDPENGPFGTFRLSASWNEA
jgi:hypothetical protein